MWLTRMRSVYPPSRLLTGSSSVRPSASQIAMSIAALAVGLATVRASRVVTTSRSVSVRPTIWGAKIWSITAMMLDLRLAVGERPRRRLGHADDPVIGMHPHQYVLRGMRPRRKRTSAA